MADAARDMLVTTVKKFRSLDLPRQMFANLDRLFGTADYSDFTITCVSGTFKVHKAIVCSRSEFFRRAERFAIGQESGTKAVDLPEDDPKVVKLLIQYMYEGEYEPKAMAGSTPLVTVMKQRGYHYNFPHKCQKGCVPPQHKVCPHQICSTDTCHNACVDFVCEHCCEGYLPDSVGEDANQLLLHAKMYEAADKYTVEGLKELVIVKFFRCCVCLWDTEYFAPAAQYAFSTTPENDKGLRDVVSRTIAGHIDLLNKPPVEALLNEHNGLAVGLLKMKANAIGWTRSADVSA